MQNFAVNTFPGEFLLIGHELIWTQLLIGFRQMLQVVYRIIISGVRQIASNIVFLWSNNFSRRIL